MKILYCDATLAVSGDMFLGALVDLGVPIECMRSVLGTLGLEGADITSAPVIRRGLRATHVTVDAPEDHRHRRLADVRRIIDVSSLDDSVKADSIAVFERLAGAEAAVHGRAIDEILFHEVGALDAVIDVVAASAGLRELACDLVLSSPIATGAGFVVACHGKLPVPAPATTELLRGAAVTGGDLEGECATPTGVALLRHFAPRQEGLPDMTVENIGSGAGARDPATHPNCFRLILGSRLEREVDAVIVLETNIDDMSPQSVGFLFETLLQAGALDVYATSVQMKKGRPGFLLSVISTPQDRCAMEEIVFKETTTLGIRRHAASRTKLPRSVSTVQTPFGEIDVKVGLLDGRAVTVAPEHDDVARAARACSVPYREVREAAKEAYLKAGDRA